MLRYMYRIEYSIEYVYVLRIEEIILFIRKWILESWVFGGFYFVNFSGYLWFYVWLLLVYLEDLFG